MNKTFTLKELKELDAKATSALDNLKHNQGRLDMDGCIVSVSRQAVDETIAFIEYTRNALPDLIRVIELAEDELNHVDKIIKELKNDKYGRFRPTKAQGEAIWFSVSQALTEIRKLKGE